MSALFFGLTDKDFMKTLLQVYQDVKLSIEKWLLRRRLRMIMKEETQGRTIDHLVEDS